MYDPSIPSQKSPGVVFSGDDIFRIVPVFLWYCIWVIPLDGCSPNNIRFFAMWEKKILEIVCGRLDFWLRLPNFGHTSLELQAEIHTIHYVGKNSEVTFKTFVHEYKV